MSANDKRMEEVTLEGLADKIAEVSDRAERAQAEAESLRAENASLSGRLGRLEGNGRSPLSARQSLPARLEQLDGVEAVDHEHIVSRRGAMKALGAAAAGGVGLAVGSVMLSETPAAAANGDALLVGETTNAATARTTLTKTGSDIGLYSVLGAASGIATTTVALAGDSNVGDGVGGFSASGVGVSGESTSGIGVVGDGVLGVWGRCTATSGLRAGVVGTGKGSAPGVVANSDIGAALEMAPLTDVTNTLPASPLAGQFVVLNNGSLWYCAVNGHWVQLNKQPVNLLAGPIRVFDSRTNNPPAAIGPRPKAPLTAGTVTPLQITGATVGGLSVPAGAVGVIGNVTVTSVVANGWLNLYPAGGPTPTPSTPSNINYQPGENALANFCIVALNGSGQMSIFAAQGTTDVIFDVTGYLL